jgi:hypothetical protein
MDATNYTSLKTAKNIQMVKIGDSFAVSIQKYNPDTGEPVAPVIEAIDRKQIEALKAKLLAQIAQLDEVLKDMASLGLVK